MKRKGFTLVELLAVIIILAVVALIATPIILNVVDDAKKSAAESEGRMVLSGVKSYCETSKMKAEMQEDYEYECKKRDAETADEFKERVATIAGIASNKISVETDANGEISIIVVDQDSYESTVNMTNSTVRTEKKGEETTRAAGLYASGTNTLLMSWDEMITQGVISVNGSTFMGTDDSYYSEEIREQVDALPAVDFVIADGITEFDDMALYGVLGNEVNLYLPSSITKIQNDVINPDGTAIVAIHFAGTKSEWNAVDIGNNWLGAAAVVEVICSDGAVPTNYLPTVSEFYEYDEIGSDWESASGSVDYDTYLNKNFTVYARDDFDFGTASLWFSNASQLEFEYFGAERNGDASFDVTFEHSNIGQIEIHNDQPTPFVIEGEPVFVYEGEVWYKYYSEYNWMAWESGVMINPKTSTNYDIIVPGWIA